jgi:phosphoglycerate kinase
MNLLKAKEVKNKKVLVRVDFNVSDFKKDHYRFQCAKKTIDFLLKSKVKQIILISHLGRPKNKEEKYSLNKLIPILQKTFNHKIKFHNKLDNLPEDKIVLLENIRF